MKTKFPDVVPGDTVITRGSGWFHTLQNKRMVVTRTTETAVYVRDEGSKFERGGYTRTGWPRDQYFEKVLMKTKFVAFVATEGGMNTVEVEGPDDTGCLGYIGDKDKFKAYFQNTEVGDVIETGNAILVCLPEEKAKIILR